ncbi:MAG: prolyl oligopeptidase family serine peptidase [Gammaproteobacteria bacterium]|nr:prolyl oligopeptidase family serine peptidase [Gammaproteobacteria bacterium]
MSTSGPDVGDQRIGNLVVRSVPEIPAALIERMQRYRNTRSATLVGWLDSGMLIRTRFADTTQLHRVRSPLGAREQLTFFSEPVRTAHVPPGHRASGFVFPRDIGGSEFYQLFWFDWLTGDSRLISDGKSRYTNVVWANAGDRFAYTTTERDGRSWDIHVQDLHGNVAIALETQAGAWGVADWSPGDDRILVDNYVSINESYLYELDLDSGVLTPLLDQDLEISIGSVSYSGDGNGIYFTSDLGAEFMRLHYLDLHDGSISVLTADVPWNVEGMAISPDGGSLAFAINEGGLSRLRVWKLPDHAPLALPELPLGTVYGLKFSPNSRHLGFTVNGPAAPGDVYSLDLAARNVQRWTRSEVGGLSSEEFALPELIAYPTFDQVDATPRMVPAFVYRPGGPGPHPVVVSIHGGPEGQYRPRFSAMIQYYVNELSLAVVIPNVRGSAGYGKSYLKLDNGYLRENAVKDIGTLLDWIATDPGLDASRVVVSGGSYGGYMVLASMVHYSDRLVAGVERVGISNFVSFLSNTQEYRRDLRRAEYGDERDPQMRAFLEDISPLNQTERITRPLMISQGNNDPRVPASESEQIVAALEAAGKPVWYVLAMDEGHGFSKKVNSDYNAAATVLFLERFLLGK